MKKMNKKGFTLAELLIVVAIIAVLVAVAIPVFNAQLEKSRQATDLANLRSSYAEAMASLLVDNSGEGASYTMQQHNGPIATTLRTGLDASLDAAIGNSNLSGKQAAIFCYYDNSGSLKVELKTK